MCLLALCMYKIASSMRAYRYMRVCDIHIGDSRILHVVYYYKL